MPSLSQIAPKEVSTSPSSATHTLGTAGACWWTPGGQYQGPPPGRRRCKITTRVHLRHCMTIFIISNENKCVFRQMHCACLVKHNIFPTTIFFLCGSRLCLKNLPSCEKPGSKANVAEITPWHCRKFNNLVILVVFSKAFLCALCLHFLHDRPHPKSPYGFTLWLCFHCVFVVGSLP